MSGPKPRCALCGGSLRRHASIVYSWPKLSGEPAVGWHAGSSASCWDKDARDRRAAGSGEEVAAALVAEVEARGSGRVVFLAPQRRLVDRAAS